MKSFLWLGLRVCLWYTYYGGIVTDVFLFYILEGGKTCKLIFLALRRCKLELYEQRDIEENHGAFHLARQSYLQCVGNFQILWI